MINQEAETGLYGIDKGKAQVINVDTTPAMQELMQKRQSAKAAAKAKGQADIDKDLAAVDEAGKAIWQRDAPYFKESQKKLSDYTEANHDKLGAHDPTASMEFHRMLGGLIQSAELSHNAREKYEAVITSPQYQKMRPEAKAKFDEFSTKAPADYNDLNKAFSFTPDMFEQTFDVPAEADDIKKNLTAKLTKEGYESAQGGGTTTTNKETTREDAKAALDERLKQKPEFQKEILLEMKKMTPEQQKKYETTDKGGLTHLDVNKYADEKILPHLYGVTEHEKITKENKPGKAYAFNKGNGTWENDKYRWAYQAQKEGDLPKEDFNFAGAELHIPALKGDRQEINFASTAEGENKPVFIDMPDGTKKQVVPIGYRTDNGKDWQFVGVPMTPEGKPDVGPDQKVTPVIVPAQYANAKIKAEFGFDINDAVKKLGTGVTSGTGGSTGKRSGSSESSNGKPGESSKKVKKSTAKSFDSDFEALKVGESIIGPDGKTYKKK
jgi:hypothetical protein